MTKKRVIAPGLVLLVGIGAVSTASIFVRYAQAEASSLVIAAGRLTLASLVLAPLAWYRHRGELRRLEPADWRWAAVSGLFLALHFATWISSLEYSSVASSVVLVSTSPLWVALAAWLLLRERLTPPVLAGLVIALAGVVIIGLSDTQASTASEPLLGNGLALAGALMAAGYLLIGRRLRGKLSLAPYIAVVYGTAALVLNVMVAIARQPIVGYRPMVYVWILLLALVPQLIGHSSFNWALAYLPATFVAIATLGEPIGSTLLAYVLLGEAPTLAKVVGAGLILAGIVLALSAGAGLKPAPTQ
ncbi:MAG: DMT family transporter [Thermoflexales bacterium]|nr:DMT family transporter [Thermoflexales bacterium]